MKNKQEHTIDKITKDLLKDFSVQAPNGAFSSIHESYEYLENKKQRQFYIYFAASWLILIAFGIGYISQSLSFDTQNNAENKQLKDKYNYLSFSKENIKISHPTISENSNKLITTSYYKHCNKQTIISSLKQSKIDNLKQPTSIVEIATKEDDSISLTKLDSLKLFYKYITLTGNKELTDSLKKSEEIIAYNEPMPDLIERQNSSWSIIGGVTPMMGFDFNNNQQIPVESRLKSNFSEVEIKKEDISVAFSTGLAIKKQIAERWNVRSGLNYNSLNESNVQVNYLEFPVISEYSIVNKKFKVYFTNGIAAGIKQKDFHPVGISGLTFQYPINKTIDLRFEPSYKHIFGNSWIYKSNYYGVMAGLNISF